MPKVVVIGAGFAGLASASILARDGFEVKLIEKNDQAGGRARSFNQSGFTFDMGPSWYWMPDVFDRYFNEFERNTQDFYDLKRLDPSYRVFFGPDDILDLPAGENNVINLFESIEKGSGKLLQQFLKEAAYKYKVGMDEFVFKPGHSILEFADIRIFKSLFHLQMLTPISKIIREKFKNPKLRKLLEFPVLFLGATPEKTPALYSMMNYADISLGTWYPMGGMHKIIEGMVQVAESVGVELILDQAVNKIEVQNKKATHVHTEASSYIADAVIGSADYHHVESKLLEPTHRQYSSAYWESRTMAPSSLLFYLGIDKKVKNLLHHNLFFDEDFATHAIEIYEDPKWPSKPLFYVCCPSKTDVTVAPIGNENIFILIPLAPGLHDDESTREKYYEIVMERLETLTGDSIKEHVIYKRSFAMDNFEKEYNAFKGNAYGLANTLKQTAILKPKIKSKKINNLYFCGQLTNPGPGVPPSLISGQVVAKELKKQFRTQLTPRHASYL